jgi:outer membrane protein assembly factor BamB
MIIFYSLLPFAVFGQVAVTQNYPRFEYSPFGQASLEGKPGNELTVSPAPTWRGEGNFRRYGEDFPLPLTQNEMFGQAVYSEPLSLTSIGRSDVNKMGVSATGGVIYTGTDDVFAYAHYGRTGKLIWRTSPIANNMMATRWSLANFSIFGRATLHSISSQLK